MQARFRTRGTDCARRIARQAAPTGWIDGRVAVDLAFAVAPQRARKALEGVFADTDVVVQPAAGREKRLLVADMDSTMITVECIDELADYAGIKAEIAAVTEAAMRGELDFAAALDARVALLKESRRGRDRPLPGGAGAADAGRADVGRDDAGAGCADGAGVGRVHALCRAGGRAARV